MHHNSTYANVTYTVTQKTMPLLASHGLTVAAAHRIETHTLDHRKVRIAVADWNSGPQRDCWPLHETRLTEDFARITDEASLLDFNGRYGLLGYDWLHRAAEVLGSSEAWRGDPVCWALAHARVAAGIAGVVEIINDVRSGKVDLAKPSLVRALFSQFKKIGLESIFTAGRPRRWEGFTWARPEALVNQSESPLRKRFSANWGQDPIGTAYFVLAWVLNQYVQTVRFEFASLDFAARFFGMEKAGPPRFGPELRWNALLQVIYWQLAEDVGGAFRQCRRCGRVFPMRTGKDEFCDPRCGAASRSKRYRDRKKAKRRSRKRRAPRRKHSGR